MTYHIRSLVAVGIVLGSFCVAPAARAQECVGAAPLSTAPLQIGAGFGFASDSQRGLGASFVGGTDRLFGGLSGQYTTIVGTTGMPSIAGSVGGELAAGGVAHLCLINAVGYTSGPTLGPVEQGELDLASGLRVGLVIAETSTVAVVPTFGVALQFARATEHVGAVDLLTVTQRFGVAQFGVGLVVRQQFAVTPMIVMPFAGGPSDTQFRLTVSYNFAMH